jgi:hypothetical protein
MDRSRFFVCLLLGFCLALAGLPVHAEIGGASESVPLEVAESGFDCPHHQASQAPLSDHSADDLDSGHDCCGPDCPCACAGLSMVPNKRFQAPLALMPATQPSSHAISFSPHPTERLLRPPQA